MSVRFSEPTPIATEGHGANLKLSCRQAAEILGGDWSEDRVHAFAKAGVIPSYSVESRIYIHEVELRAWMSGEWRKTSDSFLLTLDRLIQQTEQVTNELWQLRREANGGK